jgi:rod shape-determining protein MreC
MENFFSRYKNPLTLMAVLFIQVVGLATQVKRPEGAKPGTTGSGTRLIRVWTVTAFTPVEKMFVSTGHFFSNGWHNYADLRGVRKQNEELQQEIERLRMEQVRLRQDADQARRLQALLEFRQKFVDKTVTAQVISTSGTEQSRVIIIDKGSRDGMKPDMAVITPDGIVGKVKEVFPLSSQVLMINDHDSGVGVILESTRLQGILKGTSFGELQITYIMSDEKVEAGEHVITSGGDGIYPKGLSVGTVVSASPDRDNDPFLSIKLKPSADLRRLEEVLVITKMAEETPSVASGSNSLRAADILAQRLPSIPKQDPNAPKVPGGPTTGVPGATPSPTPVKTPKPAGAATEQKPVNTVQNPPLSGAAAAKPTPNPLKPPVSGTGTTVPATGSPNRPATGTGATTPVPNTLKPPAAGTGTAGPGSAANKAGAETKKPPSTGTGSTTPAGSGGATPGVTAAPPKPTPKATPKKSPTPATDSTTGASGSKATDQSGTNAPAATPAATPSPTPERPPR